jgi:hypothetical protein
MASTAGVTPHPLSRITHNRKQGGWHLLLMQKYIYIKVKKKIIATKMQVDKFVGKN